MACAHARLGGPCRRIPAHNRASQLRLGSGGGRLGSRSVVSELEQAMGRRPAGSRPSDASAGAPGPWRSRCHRFRLPLTVGSESICVFGPHTHTHTARAVTVRCTHGAQSACPAPPRGPAQSESLSPRRRRPGGRLPAAVWPSKRRLFLLPCPGPAPASRSLANGAGVPPRPLPGSDPCLRLGPAAVTASLWTRAARGFPMTHRLAPTVASLARCPASRSSGLKLVRPAGHGE